MSRVSARLVADYTSGLGPDPFAGVTVVAPDDAKRAFSDPAPRAAYMAAFREALELGPEPVLCLVGPYGYSPAFTAAAGGRNDLAHEKIDPNRVHVLNVGRSFLGLGALTASIATSSMDPEAATEWLDDAGVATAMWLVAESERLERAAAEAFVEAPDGLPEERYALLRVRLAARLVGGFDTVAAARAAAFSKAGGQGGTGLVAGATPGLAAWQSAGPANVEWRECALPTFLASHFGEALAFAIAPRAPS